MTPERWQQVRDLVQSTMQLAPERRIAYLEQHCSDDPSLRKDVDSLLAVEHELRSSFLESPAIAHVTPDQNTAASASWKPGMKLGPYEIQSLLGAGGMGEVYRARDTRLDRTVALKVLPVLLSSDPARKQRFEREARAIAALQHPNICTLHDVGQQQGVDYLVMEYLEGETLAERLTKGPLPLEQILRFGVEITDALDAAHRRGVVHRDLKPGNIFLTTHGECKVLDFGLAKLEESHAEQETLPLAGTEASKKTLTTPGFVIGTVAYMSPEQARGGELDARTDLFSFGAVLYEMETGRMAFPGKNAAVIHDAILNRAPTPLARVNPDFPPDLERIVNKALEKDRKLRYQSAAEIRTDLQRVRRDTESAKLPATTAEVTGRTGTGWKWMVAVGLAVAVLVLCGYFYLRLHRVAKLTDKDTIVLADFDNRTGDPVFDDTLKTALVVSLRQSPFLDVLSDNKLDETLKMMNRTANTKLTPDVARELCQRAGSKAYLVGSIASLGSEYVLGLKAVSCESSDTLALEQATAAVKEKVLTVLGELVSKLRSQLGESLATVQRFDVPLEQATTESLDALRAYTLGIKAHREKGIPSALPYFEHAIQLDPRFATAYSTLGDEYISLGEPGRAAEYLTKAFELRTRTSERERLAIESAYYMNVTGELDKAEQTLEEKIENYPKSEGAYSGLSVVYGEQGKYQKSLDIFDRMPVPSGNKSDTALSGLRVMYLLPLQRFDEVRQSAKQGHREWAGDYILHSALYGLSFLDSDSPGMATEQKWFADHPEYEDVGLALASDSEAFGGHLRRADEFSQQAKDAALRANSREGAALWLVNTAIAEAAFGNSGHSRVSSYAALKLAPTSPAIESEVALALAMVGDEQQAQSLGKDLNKRFPVDTQIQSLVLPAVRAQLALNRNQPVEAINELHAALPIELGSFRYVNNLSCLYPTYIRGRAYLAAEHGAQAAAEFQKILDHSGIVWNCWTEALARLGVARANALVAKTSQGADADLAGTRAINAYKDFLDLWKDADPDIPILKQAKAEYAGLK